jgi:hypothetical protein
MDNINNTLPLASNNVPSWATERTNANRTLSRKARFESRSASVEQSTNARNLADVRALFPPTVDVDGTLGSLLVHSRKNLALLLPIAYTCGIEFIPVSVRNCVEEKLHELTDDIDTSETARMVIVEYIVGIIVADGNDYLAKSIANDGSEWEAYVANGTIPKVCTDTLDILVDAERKVEAVQTIAPFVPLINLAVFMAMRKGAKLSGRGVNNVTGDRVKVSRKHEKRERGTFYDYNAPHTDPLGSVGKVTKSLPDAIGTTRTGGKIRSHSFANIMGTDADDVRQSTYANVWEYLTVGKGKGIGITFDDCMKFANKAVNDRTKELRFGEIPSEHEERYEHTGVALDVGGARVETIYGNTLDVGELLERYVNPNVSTAVYEYLATRDTVRAYTGKLPNELGISAEEKRTRLQTYKRWLASGGSQVSSMPAIAKRHGINQSTLWRAVESLRSIVKAA